MKLKEKIHVHYREALQQKIAALQQRRSDLVESLAQETKSTAGDKYETGRAMVHIEQENIAAQLGALLLQLAELDSIDIEKVQEKAGKGALVKTNQGFFFISIAMGKAVVDGLTIYALSPQAPLGKLFEGLTAGQAAMLNGNSYLIEAIE